MAGGDLRSSQTIWNFRGDASVLRTVIATNVDDGIADRVDASGSWQAQGNTVAITYAPPDTGTVQFTFVVHDSTLTLGGLLFSRIP